MIYIIFWTAFFGYWVGKYRGRSEVLKELRTELSKCADEISDFKERTFRTIDKFKKEISDLKAGK